MKKLTKIVAVVLCNVMVLTGCTQQPKTAKIDGLSFTIPGYYTEDASSSVEEASSTMDVTKTTTYTVSDEEDGSIKIGFAKTDLKADSGNTGGTVIKFLMGLMGVSTNSIKEQSEKEINGYKTYIYKIVENEDDIKLAWIANTDSGYYDIVACIREQKDGKWPQKHDYDKDFDEILESVNAQ